MTWMKAGVAPGIFQPGADFSNEGAKIWLSGYYKCQKSPTHSRSPSDGGLVCSDGGYSPLALSWHHPWMRRAKLAWSLEGNYGVSLGLGSIAPYHG